MGSDEGHSIGDIAAIVKKVWMRPEFAANRSREPQVSIAQKPDPAKPILRYVPLTNFCRERLHLKPLVSLESGVYKTLMFHLQNSNK